MQKNQISFYLVGVILLTALPALASLLYFKISGDPSFRPLSVTVASLTESSVGRRARGITVLVNWGKSANSASTPAQVVSVLEKALALYPMDFVVRVKQSDRSDIQVFFLVDGTDIGPYRLQSVANGIPAAISAYNMTTQPGPVENAWKY